MIYRKLFSALNFKILYNKVIAKPYFDFAWSKRNHDKNSNNIAVLSKKSYCTDSGVNIPFQGTKTEKKPLMLEKDQVMIEEWLLEMCKSNGIKVTKQISEEQLEDLFNASCENERLEYLTYLARKEDTLLYSKIAKERIKTLKGKQKQKRMNRPKGHIEYGLWKNAMFTKLNKRHIVDLYQHRMVSVMKFGQPLIIDLGYEEHMNGREVTSCANQLARSISLNRSNIDPFNLMFCNVDFDSKGFNKFKKVMPSIRKPSFPMTITSESYLDLFPKVKLVYLSPDADETLETFDHDAVYIIGGIVDLGVKEPLTLPKAKREDIKMQKLPLDNYHIFKGPKTLPLYVMMAILLDVQEHGDWSKAFRAIPRRLIQTEEYEPTLWRYKSRPWLWT